MVYRTNSINNPDVIDIEAVHISLISLPYSLKLLLLLFLLKLFSC